MKESLNYFILFSLSFIISLNVLVYHHLRQTVFDTTAFLSSPLNWTHLVLYFFNFSWFLLPKQTGGELVIHFLKKFKIFRIDNTFLRHLISRFPRFDVFVFGKKHHKEQSCQFLKNNDVKSRSMLAIKNISSKLFLKELNRVVSCANNWFEGDMPRIIILRYHILQNISNWPQCLKYFFLRKTCHLFYTFS